ncbi:MAG TPA: F0F1 ATP synthase subunit B [Bacteroidia bacterium]|nr:F0F1 ATP synthase subunit B [Bacteroidia bacterium]
MKLVTPDIGLLFWMLVSFSIVLFLLKKYAWKPILASLKEREESIAGALNSAKKAKEEMLALKSDNEKILAEARNQRDLILKEARDAKESIINEARTKATTEADRLLQLAREGIQNEKMAAITELKNQVAVLSLEIAEKILKEELSSAEKQQQLVSAYLKEAEFVK